MKDYIQSLEEKFSEIEHGFKIEEAQAKNDFKTMDEKSLFQIAHLAYASKVYQVRMYAVFLFGYLSKDDKVFNFMQEQVSKDENWRVQEVLAKSFDYYCSQKGYQNALEDIDNWIHHNQPNVRRAVIEGLRIWTSRAYFNANPHIAIQKIVQLKADESEYVRKSVGNALRDISKHFPDLIQCELSTWKLNNPKIIQVYKLACKRI